MVSSRSRKPLEWGARVAHALKLYPAAWNGDRNRLRLTGQEGFRVPILDLRLRFHPWIPILVTWTLVSSMLYIVGFLLFGDPEFTDFTIGFWCLVQTYLFLVMQIRFLLDFESIGSTINLFLAYDERQMRKFGISEEDADGLEGVALALEIVSVCSTILVFPVAVFILRSPDIKIFKHYLILIPEAYDGTAVYLGATMIMLSGPLFWAHVTVIWGIILYSNSLPFILRKIREQWVNPKSTREEKREAEISYRAAQVLTTSVLNTLPFLLPAVSVGVGCMLLGCIYSLIVEIHRSGSLLFISINILAIGALLSLTQVSFSRAALIRLSSMEFYKIPFLNERVRFTRKDRLFLASCAPIQIVLGGAVKVTRTTYPVILQDVILAYVVNMLVLGF